MNDPWLDLLPLLPPPVLSAARLHVAKAFRALEARSGAKAARRAVRAGLRGLTPPGGAEAEMLAPVAACAEMAKAWEEALHPRGAPDNPGRFAPKPNSRSALFAKLAGVTAESLLAAGRNALHVEHAVKDWVASGASALVEKLPAKWRPVVKGCWLGVRLGTQTAFATYTAGQAAAEAVAKERGATPEQAKTLRAALSAIDVTLAKPVLLTLEFLGMEGAAAGMAFVPVGSLTYLAYSTARDPLSVYRAARKAFARVLAKLTTRKSLEAFDAASAVYDALALGSFSDESLAVFLAALDATGDVRLAAEAMREVYAGGWGTKAFDESKHPRDHGKFAPVARVEAAASDPAKLGSLAYDLCLRHGVRELRAACRHYGLDSTGTQVQLAERLEEHAKGKPAAPTPDAPSGPSAGPSPSPEVAASSVADAVRLHADHGLAPMGKVREALAASGITDRAGQDAAIQAARRAGSVTASNIEGRHGVTAEERAAALPGDAGAMLGFLSIRD